MQTYRFKYISKKEYKTIRLFLEYFRLSKSKIYKLFLNQGIWINHTLACEIQPVSIGDEIWIDYPMETTIRPIKKKLEIIYEDDNVLLINKPSGILVHCDGSNQETLDHYVLGYLPQLNPMHVHRLDKDTSGLILYAKDPLSFSFFNDALSRHEIQRNYLAICEGVFKEKRGTIRKAIGTDRHQNGKMVICKSGKEAITHYWVVKQFSNYALVSLKLETGRTHQIRVHMASIGHPLVNDILYGAREKEGRIALHSSEIFFYHPQRDCLEHFTCNFPADLVKYTENK